MFLQQLHARLSTLRVAALAPWVLRGARWTPPQQRLLLAPVGAPPPAAAAGTPLFQRAVDALLLMAAPKKRRSYTRNRVRRHGQQEARGPHLKGHMYMCPVCERMRAPHRVCGSEHCQTYWKHRWF